jgi:N-methylhydantoinase B/oxoprolinase/acetone carboxylase alpha subunit
MSNLTIGGSDRFRNRHFTYYDTVGGGAGATGANYVAGGGQKEKLPGKINTRLQPGDRVMIETPGGGAYDRPSSRRRPK